MIERGTGLFAILGSVFTTVFTFLYGDSEMTRNVMILLAFVIVLDWLSGISASKKDNTYSSAYGLQGINRTFFIVVLPALGHLVDDVVGTPNIFIGLLAAGVLYHTLQSMTANAIRAGWGNWFPDWLLNKLTDLVKDEIDAKLSRSVERLKTKEQNLE